VAATCGLPFVPECIDVRSLDPPTSNQGRDHRKDFNPLGLVLKAGAIVPNFSHIYPAVRAEAYGPRPKGSSSARSPTTFTTHRMHWADTIDWCSAAARRFVAWMHHQGAQGAHRRDRWKVKARHTLTAYSTDLLASVTQGETV